MSRRYLALLRTFTVATSVVGAASVAGHADDFHAIYHNISGEPGYEVPGLGGTGFKFHATSTIIFPWVSVSGNGDWALGASADLATSEDNVLILNGQLVAHEGTPTPFAPTENYGTMLAGTKGAFNNNGTLVFANNTSGPTTSDQYMLKLENGVMPVVAQEGQPTGLISNTNWGSSSGSPVITNNGTVGFIANVAGEGVITGNDGNAYVAVIGNQVIARQGVTTVTIPSSGNTGTLNFNNATSRLSASADGSHYILGSLVTGTNGALTNWSAIVDGNVVIEHNQPTAGMFSPVDKVSGVHMDAAGNWFAGGVNYDTQDWIIRNGVLIAAENAPVGGGSTVWTQLNSSTGFSIMTGNSLGDYLIGGWDNSGAGGAPHALMMLNGNILARQGDPVDLDGNGLFDDNAFFGNRFIDGGITDNGTIFVTALLQDSDGVAIGSGFFTIPEPTSMALCLLGTTGLLRRRRI